jgi:hypothetical protein
MRGVLDSDYKKITKIKKYLPSLFPPKWYMNQDTRSIRLRGLEPGDVRRYIDQSNQPSYLQRSDLANIGLETLHLESLRRSDQLPDLSLGPRQFEWVRFQIADVIKC